MEHDYMSSSDESSSASYSSEESTRLEECLINGERLQLPAGLCENTEVFNEFFSAEMWLECLSEDQKRQLKAFLPTFPDDDDQNKEETLDRLFSRCDMRFGGAPLDVFHTRLQSGYYRPDIARMRGRMRRSLARNNFQLEKAYYARTVREVLVSRDNLLRRSRELPFGVAAKMERTAVQPVQSSKLTKRGEHRAKRRYFQELAAIRQEVGESDQSSEDENFPEGPLARVSKKQKRHLAALECALTAELPVVTSTFSLKPTGLDLELNVTPTSNPYEMTEETYKRSMVRHKKRRDAGDDHPELNTLGITMQDVVSRMQLDRKQPSGKPGHAAAKPSARRAKTKPPPTAAAAAVPQAAPAQQFVNAGSSLLADSSGSDLGDSDEDDRASSFLDEQPPTNPPTPAAPPPYSLPPAAALPPPPVAAASPAQPSAATPAKPVAAARKRAASNTSPRVSKAAKKIKVEPEEEGGDYAVTSVAPPPAAQTEQSPGAYMKRHMQAATLSDLDGIDMMNLPIDLDDSPGMPMDSMEDIKPTLELMQETHACFFSLIRDVICSTSEHRMNLSTVEDRLRAWQGNPISPLNDWYSQANEWVAQLQSAIMFLCGDYADAQPEDFVPYVEYKPQSQAYQWIGAGRDSDSHLQPLCSYWLEHRDEMVTRPVKQEVEVEGEDSGENAGDEMEIIPPPPRFPTTWAVRPTSADEKELFREQEAQRYDNPHRSFTFRMHDYESVVGPVKGVYNQSVGITKPRGHSLLVPDRPNFVTILCLVRDSTARLPNGEGTRTDICELLKDSQYLADVQVESYLHSVVSGALDRLHYETDPCVKYDTKRKIWIYLHRGRTEEEFERLHQQFQGVAKTKKSSSHRKPPRKKDPINKSSSTPGFLATDSAPVLSPSPALEAAVPAAAPTLGAGSPPAKPAVPGRAARPAGQKVTPAQALQAIQVATTPIPAPGIASPLPPGTAGPATAATVANTTAVAAATPLPPAVATQQVLAAQAARNVAAGLREMAAATAARAAAATTAVACSPSPVTQTVRMPVASINATSVAPQPRLVSTNRVAGPTIRVALPTAAAPQAAPTIGLLGLTAQPPPPLPPAAKPAILQQKVAGRGKAAGGGKPRAPGGGKPRAAGGGKPRAAGGGKPKALPTVKTNVAGATQQSIVVSQAAYVATPKLVTAMTGKLPPITAQSNAKLVNAVKAAVSNAVVSQQLQQQLLQQQQQQQPQTAKQQKQLQQQKQIQFQLQQQLLAQQQKLTEQATTNLVTQQQQQQQQLVLQQQGKTNILQKQMQQQLQQLKQQQQQQIAVNMLPGATGQRVVTTLSVLNPSASRVVTRMAPTAGQVAGKGGQAGAGGPLLGKVLANVQGQMITMESLLAHQKQHGSLPQALRMTTGGGKPGQTSLIQIPSTVPGGVPQYAVVSQGNILSVGQPRIVPTTLVTQAAQMSTPGITHQTVTVQQSQGGNLVNALTGRPIPSNAGGLRMVAGAAGTVRMVASKPGTAGGVRMVTGGNAAAGTLRMVAGGTASPATMRMVAGSAGTVRMVGGSAGTVRMNAAAVGAGRAAGVRVMAPGAGGLNLATIGGKPVLLASKGQAVGGAGQNVYLTTQAGGQGQTVMLASQALRGQGGHLVLQGGGGGQIVLPPGFHGGTLNIKTLQGLQGLKVIPLAQAQGGKGGRQQVYARILSPGVRPATMTGLVQQQLGAGPTTLPAQTVTVDPGAANPTAAADAETSEQ